MISNDIMLNLCCNLVHVKITVIEKSESNYSIICNGEKNNLRIYKGDDDLHYAEIHEGTILKANNDWYMELPMIQDNDTPIITYVEYFSGVKEAVAVTLSYNIVNGNNGIIDVPIDEFNKKVSTLGFKNIQDWDKRDFVKYKLIKDDHDDMFGDMSIELIDFIK